MDKNYRADLLAAVKANPEEWNHRIRQCGRRIISAVTFRETARSTHEKTGTVLLSVIGYYYSVFHISIATLYLDLWVPKTSSAGWIDAKRAAERQPY
jgi:hypothetical protein